MYNQIALDWIWPDEVVIDQKCPILGSTKPRQRSAMHLKDTSRWLESLLEQVA